MKQLFLLLYFFSTTVFSQVLPPNAPERQQLIAMGAEILLERSDSNYTFFKLGSDSFFIGKNSERTVIGRNFARSKTLNSTDEFELYKLLNKFNRDQIYQFVLYEKSFQANLYILGEYEPKVFAKAVLAASKVETVFDINPNIFKLVNN
jgi:hypothetical protein